jgi:hypothetical protein
VTSLVECSCTMNTPKVGSPITEHLRRRENPLRKRAKKLHGKIVQGGVGSWKFLQYFWM